MSKFDHLYKPARKYCAINNGDGIKQDSSLMPVVYRLPDPPKDKTTIKNYGLHPDHQVYRRDILPSRLKVVEEEVMYELQKSSENNKNDRINGYRIVDLFWKKVDLIKDELYHEIEFIKMVQWKRVYGEWAYIDGQPIWIPPWHYQLLNWWFMVGAEGEDIGYPEFRIRDWKSYVHKHYIYKTTETFDNIGKDGLPVKGNDGRYKMRDMGMRLFYGDIQPKNRRSGATHQALCGLHEIITHGLDRHATMVSKSKTDVEKHFDDKFVPAWRKMPLFMKPIWNGNNEPAINLEYKAPANVFGQKVLGSSFFITKNTSEAVVDSMTLDGILLDEQGKETGGGRVNVFSRWRVSRQTLSTGSGTKIRGFAFNPSSTEEMDDGAKNYLEMCDGSNFYIRNAVGQTSTGLALIVFPAQYCLEGFIDKFGKAVVSKPTDRQKRLNPKALFTKLNMGSRDYLLAQRDALLKENTPSSRIAYREEIRKQPMEFSEMWMGGGGEIGFPSEAIDKRLSEGRIDGDKWIDRGEFFRDGGKDGRVYWRSSDNGRFEISYKMSDDMTNQQTKKMIYDVYKGRNAWHLAPLNPKVVIGADPFAFENRQKSKLREGQVSKSDGGIAGYYPFDPKVDDPEKDSKNWHSDRFILSYRYRPESDDEYYEDLLMACIYFNALCYPENNVRDAIKYFIFRGYGGYLKFDVNPMTGKPQEVPGYYVGEATKKGMFNKLNAYLVRNAYRERHMSFLEECKKIRATDELNKFDRLAAHGAALYGADDMQVSVQKSEQHVNILDAYKSLNL